LNYGVMLALDKSQQQWANLLAWMTPLRTLLEQTGPESLSKPR